MLGRDKKRRFSGRQRVVLYLASGGNCETCGAELGPGWHGDHVKPWSVGGETDVINGQALCPTCNLKKGDRDVENKRSLRKWQREALELYDQHQEKAFLVEACPGAGKSLFIAESVKRELHKGKADAFVVLVPRTELRTQMADDFHEETGIQLDPKWDGGSDGTVPLLHGNYRGVVITYQWLATGANALLLRKRISQQATLIVLDEVHHAQEEKPWGNTLRNALDPATKILLTTGTPFTTNGNPIAFVEYDEDGFAKPHYSYNYGMALTDGVVRLILFNHHKGEMEWEDEQGTVKATFDKKLDKRNIGRRLRTAIHEDHEHIGELLRKGMDKLRELREDDPDAAMLVVARDQPHAKSLAKRINQELGVTPIVVKSEDGDAASGAIRAFKKSKEPCLVAINMVSEGVTIPRIRVIVYASNVTAYLYFMQVLGRAIRTEEGHTDHTAWVFTPDDERFREFATKIMRECEEALIKREGKSESTKGPDVDMDSIWFNPLSASFTDAVATVNGIALSSSDLEMAESFKTSHTVLRGCAFSKEHIAVMMKLLGTHVTPAPANPPQETQQTTPSKPDYSKEEELRQRTKKLVGALCNKYGIEYRSANIRLNNAVGIRSSQTCFDLTLLELRRRLAYRWLIDGMGPEVSYHA